MPAAKLRLKDRGLIRPPIWSSLTRLRFQTRQLTTTRTSMPAGFFTSSSTVNLRWKTAKSLGQPRDRSCGEGNLTSRNFYNSLRIWRFCGHPLWEPHGIMEYWNDGIMGMKSGKRSILQKMLYLHSMGYDRYPRF